MATQIPKPPVVMSLPEAPTRQTARPDFVVMADNFVKAQQPWGQRVNEVADWMRGIGTLVMDYAQTNEDWYNRTVQAGNVAENEANRAKSEADRAASEVTKAKAEVTRAASEADRSERAKRDAQQLVALTNQNVDLPEMTLNGAPLIVSHEDPKRVRFADTVWNYGVGVKPKLRLDFLNQKRLDPRVTFTRATPDWDEEGNEYGIDEPVLTDKGLWTHKWRTNLFPHAVNLSTSTPLTLRQGNVENAVGDGRFTKGVTLLHNTLGPTLFYTHIPSLDYSKTYTFTAYVSVGDGGKPNIGSASNDAGLDAIFVGFNSFDSSALNLKSSLTHYKGDIWKYTATFSRPSGASPATGFLRYPTNSQRPLTVWAIQMELGGVGTPLIPTNGSQVTVAASTLDMLADSFSGKFNPSEGTIVWRVGRNNYSSAADTPPHVNMGIIGSGANNGLLAISGNSLVYHDSNGDHQESLAVPAQPFSNDEFTIAYTYTKTGVSVSHNGDLVSAEWDASEFLENAVNRLYVSGLTNGYVRALSYYDRALTDEQLQELTA